MTDRRQVYFDLLKAAEALPTFDLTRATVKDFKDNVAQILWAMRLARKAIKKHKELENDR